MVAASSGFELFWQNYVLLYGAPILQMVLWAVQVFVFIYAVVLLKRWVDFATGANEAKESIPAPPSGSAPASPVKGTDEPINVDEFVE